MVKYRDVNYVLPWIIQIGLYASPVAYSLEAVPANVRWLFDLNPLTWFLEEFRYSLLGLPAPATWQIAASVLASLGVFLLGALWFQRFEREFADHI
jgi:lipopolysaccharide transport system permease protein